MKPRHLKNQALIQFGISNVKSKSNQNVTKKNNATKNLQHYCLYSNLIPFHETKEYNEFFAWIKNWNQSQPACILIGPTSCGKSRIIQQTAKNLLCHIIDIDCASISSIKDLVSTFHESTKSRSVGIFLNHDNSNYDDAISMVVLEHVDSIISLHSPPPSSLINLISKSLVPLIMTSNYVCFQQFDWLKVIFVHYPKESFSIIKSADWIKQSIKEISTNQAVHSLLSFTDQDIRQTSLQYQVWGNNSNSILTRDKQIYLSIPYCVQEKSNPKDRREFYADICDLYNILNHDDQIFDSYIRPISEDFRSSNREKIYMSYADFAKNRIKHMSLGIFENLDLTEIVYQACLNEIPVTRNSSKPALPNGHKIKSNEIEFVKSWNLWPYEGRDLSKQIKETEKTEIIKIEPIGNSNLFNNEKPNETENTSSSTENTQNVDSILEPKIKKKPGRKKKSK